MPDLTEAANLIQQSVLTSLQVILTRTQVLEYLLACLKEH